MAEFTMRALNAITVALVLGVASPAEAQQRSVEFARWQAYPSEGSPQLAWMATRQPNHGGVGFLVGAAVGGIAGGFAFYAMCGGFDGGDCAPAFVLGVVPGALLLGLIGYAIGREIPRDTATPESGTP
jgi:hypothetical protein